MKMKNYVKGVGKGSRELLLKFLDPSISREWFEPETLNLACRLATRGTNDKKMKIGSKGGWEGVK